MKHPLCITLVVLIVSLVRPAPAWAGLWAWLEEWSGPGPFKGYTFLLTACVQDRWFKGSPIGLDDAFHAQQRSVARSLASAPGMPSEAVLFRRLLANPDPVGLYQRMSLNSFAGVSTSPDASLFQLLNEAQEALRLNNLLRFSQLVYSSAFANDGPGHEEQRVWCGYVDQGFFNSKVDMERGFPEIRTHLTDIGPSVRLHDGVDLGVGFGWVTFNGTGVTAAPHMTLTPMRLVMRPILIAVPEAYRKRWMGVLSVFWKETYVIGSLTAEDLGSATDPFSSDGELIRSFGFNFDITAALPAKWGFK
jgi:hypothetical protein